MIFLSPKATVSELCGIAGVIPLRMFDHSSNYLYTPVPTRILPLAMISNSFADQLNPEWISCVNFNGNASSIARARFYSPKEDSEDSPDGVSVSAFLRTLSALNRVNIAVGLLQQSGLCCNSFTFLKLI